MPFSVIPPPEPIEEQPSEPETTVESGSSGDAPRFGRLRPNARSGNLDGLETHELITLVEDLEDDRARARVREGIWISVIVHIVLFWLYAYGPQVLLHRPRVVNPAEVMANRQKDYEYLDLPPDALKQLHKETKVLSDKDRVAQSKHPTLDKKTLAQLEAMKPAGRPSPQPSPNPTDQERPTPQPPQQAQRPSPQQPQQPQNNPQQAQNPPRQTPQNIPDTPRPEQEAQNNPPRNPAPQKPNFNQLGNGSAHDQIQNALKNPGGSGGGFGGASAPSHHPGINSGMEILSDTMGVDFGAYMARLKYLIERSWYPLIPEAARPPISKQGVVQIRFRIGPDGQLVAQAMHLDGRSGDTSLDRAAWGGVTGASPFPPLPKDFKGPYLEIRGAFLYNLTPDQLK